MRASGGGGGAGGSGGISGTPSNPDSSERKVAPPSLWRPLPGEMSINTRTNITSLGHL